jgi:uncharacterized protein (TIGR02246 family)
MSDEDQIRARTDEYQQAFSRGDAMAVAAIFTDDGDFVGPDGVMHHGKAALEERFRGVFDGVYKGAQATIEVGAVKLLRPEIAIVDGTYELKGMKSADGQPIAVSGLYTNVWVKRDGLWSIHCLRSMIPIT